MKKFLSLLVFGLLANTLSANIDLVGNQVSRTFHMEDGTVEVIYYLSTYLHNKGEEPIRVATGFMREFIHPRRSTGFTYSFFPEQQFGKFVRYPDSAHSIVEVQPGELTPLQVIRISSEMSAEVEFPWVFEIRYRVSKEFGELYNTWYGDLVNAMAIHDKPSDDS